MCVVSEGVPAFCRVFFIAVVLSDVSSCVRLCVWIKGCLALRAFAFFLLLGHVQGVIDVFQIEQKVDCDSVSLRFCYIRLATETA